MKTEPSKFRPFVFVDKEDKNEFVIVAGTCQVSPLTFKTAEDAERYIREQPFEMFINLYATLKYYENQENEENTKSTKGNKRANK